MVQKTASTLAVEYVTAQGHVGETEGRSKIWDKNTLYKERAKRRRSGEAMVGRTTYVVWERGGLLRIVGSLRPAQLWFPLFLLRVAVVVVCLPGQVVDGGRHERGGR